MAASFQVEVGEALKEKTPVKIPVKTGFFSSVDGAPATGYRSPRFLDKGIKSSTGDAIVIITSDYGNKILSPMVDIFRDIDLLLFVVVILHPKTLDQLPTSF